MLLVPVKWEWRGFGWTEGRRVFDYSLEGISKNEVYTWIGFDIELGVPFIFGAQKES